MGNPTFVYTGKNYDRRSTVSGLISKDNRAFYTLGPVITQETPFQSPRISIFGSAGAGAEFSSLEQAAISILTAAAVIKILPIGYKI